ncbi:hypothetical protein O3Q51_07025 [Cryomorphaceae bacterium 1068]|nr:hypothetical protein [Cryomorphaceae bacterium 1068]
MSRLFILLVFASFLSVDGFGQYSHRQHQDVFPTHGNFQRKGWIVSPAITYMLPQLKNPSQRVFLPGGTAYDVAYNPAGRIGLGLEIGRFHVIDNSRLISHVQLNVGLKMLRGVERFEATLDPETNTGGAAIISNEGVFSYSYATMSFAASNIQQYSKTGFLQNTIGINGDYRIASAMTYDTDNLPIELADPSRFIFQAHYRLGLGFKISSNILLVPSVETPILNIYEYDDLKSTLKIFNTRYRPLIFRLNVYVLDKKADRKCPKNKPKRKSVERLFK